MTIRWLTIDKAAEQTGLPASYLHERTGPGGHWPEGRVWKWFDGRKLVDLDALYHLIDGQASAASQRGRRRRTDARPPCHPQQPSAQPASSSATPTCR